MYVDAAYSVKFIYMYYIIHVLHVLVTRLQWSKYAVFVVLCTDSY